MYIHQEAPLDAQQAARQQLQHIKAKEEEIKIYLNNKQIINLVFLN